VSLLRAFALTFIAISIFALPATTDAATKQEQAEAQKKFEAALTLMDKKEYRPACRLLEQSQELDPGMGTLFRLAECYEHTDRLASAHKNYHEVAKAAELAGMMKRHKVAVDRAAAIEPRVAKLQLVLPEVVANIAGLEISVDDVLVERAKWQTPIMVDTGFHKVQVAVPTKPVWSEQAKVEKEGATARVEIPASLAEGVSQPTTGTGQMVAGLVVAGVGVAAMGAGVIVGVLARADYLSAENRCPNNVCDPEGFDTRSNAMTQGDLATVIFSIGAAAVVAGTVTWLTSPSGDDSAKPEESTEASLQWSLSATPQGPFGTVTLSW